MNDAQNYTVTLLNTQKCVERTIEVSSDEYILDIAEEANLNLPYSCRAGACFDCMSKVIAGKVEQNEKALEFLKPNELREGYILLCTASPRSDCMIVTHQAEELFGPE